MAGDKKYLYLYNLDTQGGKKRRQTHFKLKPLRGAALSFTSDHVTVFSLSTSAPSRFFHWGSCNDENHTQKNAFNAVLFHTRLKVYLKDHVRIE